MRSLIAFTYFSLLIIFSVVIGGSHEPKGKINLPKIDKSKTDTLEKILDLILIKEGGKNIVGDSGKAYGYFQIHKCCVLDVNRHFKTSYSHFDMFDSLKARKVAKLYLLKGRELFRNKHKKEPTEKQLLRMYNGGYNGYKNEKTLKYLAR
jgi:hypothetical protein